MEKLKVEDLVKAGVHFGHLTRKWNPNMSPYIFMEKNGIHVIDLHKTIVKLEESANALRKIVASGRKVLFVATKKQAKDIVSKYSKEMGMPYITERWPGGMLTNFATIKKSVRKMNTIDRMKKDGTFETLSKRERLQVSRQREKLEKNLGSISEMSRIPAAIFIVDIVREHIAIAEATRLNIPIFAMVDTNSDPRKVDFPIPSNDDASKSVEAIFSFISQAVIAGSEERKSEKENSSAPEEAVTETKSAAKAKSETKAEEKVETKEVKVEETAEAKSTVSEANATDKVEESPAK